MTEARVCVEIDGEVVVAGRLFAHRKGKTESATFSYEASYLEDPRAYALDPSLPLDAAPHHTGPGRALFGCLTDSAPDRWGRLLIKREERQRAEAEGTTPRALSEAQVLLGIRDDLRAGAVRFSDENGIWLAAGDEGVPYLVDLPALLSQSDAIERDDPEAEQLRLLLRAGSSLGGARPKANVRDQDGSILIAKFPRTREFDAWDVVRWEAVALELARRAGIRTEASRMEDVGGRGVLLVHRFDRVGERRVGYASAMTMLELTDGEHASYIDIAEALEEHGSSPVEDLRELWRRIVFGVLVRNTDDHLRNHGFLRDDARSGWRLSPAFDLNPNPEPGNDALATSIDGTTDEARLDVALEVADSFRLGSDDARMMIAEVSAATSQWREVAGSYGCSISEMSRMTAAFEHRDAEAARSLG